MNTPQERALAMRLQGATYAQIGRALKISGQRAQQMLAPSRETHLLVLARASGRCENCGFGALTLAIHHLRIVGMAADAYNASPNLQALCLSCHGIAHAGPPREIDETGKDPGAVSLGRKGGKIGGKRRAETLTSEQLSAIGRKGAAARWGDSRKRATP